MNTSCACTMRPSLHRYEAQRGRMQLKDRKLRSSRHTSSLQPTCDVAIIGSESKTMPPGQVYNRASGCLLARRAERERERQREKNRRPLLFRARTVAASRAGLLFNTESLEIQPIHSRKYWAVCDAKDRLSRRTARSSDLTAQVRSTIKTTDTLTRLLPASQQRDRSRGGSHASESLPSQAGVKLNT